MTEDLKDVRLLGVRSITSAKGTFAFAKFVSMTYGEMEFFVDQQRSAQLSAIQGQSGVLCINWAFDRGRPRCELVSFVPVQSKASLAG